MPPQTDTLDALLADVLARQPDAIAITEVHPDTGAERHVSRQQLDELVARSAGWLQARGVVAGDPWRCGW